MAKCLHPSFSWQIVCGWAGAEHFFHLFEPLPPPGRVWVWCHGGRRVFWAHHGPTRVAPYWRTRASVPWREPRCVQSRNTWRLVAHISETQPLTQFFNNARQLRLAQIAAMRRFWWKRIDGHAASGSVLLLLQSDQGCWLRKGKVMQADFSLGLKWNILLKESENIQRCAKGVGMFYLSFFKRIYDEDHAISWMASYLPDSSQDLITISAHYKISICEVSIYLF